MAKKNTNMPAVETRGELYTLPDNCIANILSLTTPKDAARLAAVSSSFRSASSSDTVWDRFLPSDHREILSRAVDEPNLLLGKSKKDIFLYLCEHPVLIDGGLKIFSLDKLSGKKCFMICARDLHIVWSDNPQYWQWISVPESRFSEVAELIRVCWLEIRGMINTSLLSPGTKYAAYLIFNATSDINGFENLLCESYLGFSGHEAEKRDIWLDRVEDPYMESVGALFPELGNTLSDVLRREETKMKPRPRADGWMEVELGECFVQDGENGDLEGGVMEIERGDWKRGIIIEGIEIRPKEDET